MSPNVVLFEGADLNGRTELWETNGTAAGTFELTGVAGRRPPGCTRQISRTTTAKSYSQASTRAVLVDYG